MNERNQAFQASDIKITSKDNFGKHYIVNGRMIIDVCGTLFRGKTAGGKEGDIEEHRIYFAGKESEGGIPNLKFKSWGKEGTAEEIIASLLDDLNNAFNPGVKEIYKNLRDFLLLTSYSTHSKKANNCFIRAKGNIKGFYIGDNMTRRPFPSGIQFPENMDELRFFDNGEPLTLDGIHEKKIISSFRYFSCGNSHGQTGHEKISLLGRKYDILKNFGVSCEEYDLWIDMLLNKKMTGR